MAQGLGRGAAALAVASGIALGLAAGWVAGRWSADPPPPPPAAYVNPLADAVPGENLVLRHPGAGRTDFRVMEGDASGVLLAVDSYPLEGPKSSRQFRVSRNFFGVLLFLGGDLSPVEAENTIRDLTILSMEPENLHVQALGRTLPCWKVRAHHRLQGEITSWYSDALPVHGLVRTEGKKGVIVEVESFGKGN